MKKLSMALLVALISVLTFSCTKQDVTPVTPLKGTTWHCTTEWRVGFLSSNGTVSMKDGYLVLQFIDKVGDVSFIGENGSVITSGALSYNAKGTGITVKLTFPDGTLANSDVRILKGSYNGSKLVLRNMDFVQLK